MIGASVDLARGFAGRLAERARRIGEARAESRRRAILRDPARWRNAQLLWPNFTRDI